MQRCKQTTLNGIIIPYLLCHALAANVKKNIAMVQPKVKFAHGICILCPSLVDRLLF